MESTEVVPESPKTKTNDEEPGSVDEPQIFKCDVCCKEFNNRSNLSRHITMSHGDKKPGICSVCKTSVGSNYQMKNHIREHHFNLRAKIPFCEKKKVNQIWFENVMHGEGVMEIKKTAQNVLVMRKLGPNTAIKVQDTNLPEIDLTDMYPIRKKNSKNKLVNKVRKIFKRRK